MGTEPKWNVMDDGKWKKYLEGIQQKYGIWEKLYMPITVEYSGEKIDPEKQINQVNIERPETTLEVMARNMQNDPDKEKEATGGGGKKGEAIETLKKNKQILLIGKAGYGKTTILHCLMHNLAKEAQADPQKPKPVFIDMKYFTNTYSVIDLIRDAIEKQYPECDELLRVERLEESLDKTKEEILKIYLRDKKLYLLFDGLDKMLEEESWKRLRQFREEYGDTKMVFTTRNQGVGGDLGIDMKVTLRSFEREEEINKFVQRHLLWKDKENETQKDKENETWKDAFSGRFLENLSPEMRKLAEIPLFLKMLCAVYNYSSTGMEANISLAFRNFSRQYERRAERNSLSRLAFQMMSENTADSLYQPENEPGTGNHGRNEGGDDSNNDQTLEWDNKKVERVMGDELEKLRDHYLIQYTPNGGLRFPHRVVLEYYAAERMLRKMKKIPDEEFQRRYLNETNWTGCILRMAGLITDVKQAERMIRLAMEVDLLLAVKLAGAVRGKFLDKTLEIVFKEIDSVKDIKMRIFLLGLTRSQAALRFIMRYCSPLADIEQNKDNISRNKDDANWGAWALGEIGGLESAEKLKAVLKWAEKKDEKDLHDDAIRGLRRIWSRTSAMALKEEKRADEITCGSGGKSQKIEDWEKLVEENRTLKTKTDWTRIEDARCHIHKIESMQKAAHYYNPDYLKRTTILHLSDLGFVGADNAKEHAEKLITDLKKELRCYHLDALIIAGDITGKPDPKGAEAAERFIQFMSEGFALPLEHIVLVPGERDFGKAAGTDEGQKQQYQDYIQKMSRLIPSNALFSRETGNPESRKYNINIHHGRKMIFVGFDSACGPREKGKVPALEISACMKAVYNILTQSEYRDYLKIAVWHHPIMGMGGETIEKPAIVEQLALAGIKLVLHGHVNTLDEHLINYAYTFSGYQIRALAAGAFSYLAAREDEQPRTRYREYNLIRIDGDQVRVDLRSFNLIQKKWEKPNWENKAYLEIKLRKDVLAYGRAKTEQARFKPSEAA